MGNKKARQMARFDCGRRAPISWAGLAVAHALAAKPGMQAAGVSEHAHFNIFAEQNNPLVPLHFLKVGRVYGLGQSHLC
ncbi:MAG: hypothetical protein ACOVN9_01390, partial [Inhella sp.]